MIDILTAGAFSARYNNGGTNSFVRVAEALTVDEHLCVIRLLDTIA